MNFLTLMRNFLIENGMFESQADEVIDIATSHSALESMSSRFLDDVSGYPEVMSTLCLVSIKAVALVYIDEKCPAAWFRPMFLSTEEQKETMPEVFK